MRFIVVIQDALYTLARDAPMIVSLLPELGLTIGSIPESAMRIFVQVMSFQSDREKDKLPVIYFNRFTRPGCSIITTFETCDALSLVQITEPMKFDRYSILENPLIMRISEAMKQQPYIRLPGKLTIRVNDSLYQDWYEHLFDTNTSSIVQKQRYPMFDMMQYDTRMLDAYTYATKVLDNKHAYPLMKKTLDKNVESIYM